MDQHKSEEQLDKALKKTLGEKDVRSFRDAARQALEEVKKEAPRPKLGLVFAALRIAAGIFVLVAAIWWWRSASSPSNALQTANELLAEYDSGIDPLDQAVRGQEEEADETLPVLWRELDSLYAAGDYLAALSFLEQIQSADPEFEVISHSEWTFYHGMCFLHMEETEKALQWLVKVDKPFLEKATFFQAIALIKLDRRQEAKVLLQNISNAPSHYFKEPAGHLLNAL